jgi:tetratricopeptide (TPR) repeat protein
VRQSALPWLKDLPETIKSNETRNTNGNHHKIYNNKPCTMASLISTRLRLSGAFRRFTASYVTFNDNSTICRSEYSSLTHKHAAAAKNIANRQKTCTNRQQYAWFSDASSSSGVPPVDVTVTKTNSSDSEIPAHFKQQQYPSDAEIENTSDENEEDSSTSSTPRLSKSQDQITEEEILSLQSELRTHHRHAAYTAALATAEELLDRCTSHFGRMHPATASAYNNVGLMNKLLGNYVEAKNAFHESLQIYGEVTGKDHSSYAAPLSNLGMLERSRVLESEAEEGEDDNDASAQNEDESNVELEALRDNNNTTSEQKTKLSALERMQLNESAIEYFDEAYRIRLSELGSNHPHTIQSRTQLGSAIAAAVIAERKGRIGGLIEGELRKLKQNKEMKDPKEMEAYIPEAIARAATKSTSSSKLTQRRWDAAEEHLRGALHTAVENPRGESVAPLVYVPMGNNRGGNKEQGSGRTGLSLPPKKDRSLSKKERKMAEKERKREKRRANAIAMQQSTAGTGSGDGGDATDGQFLAVQGSASKVTTLSAATAAQNLAVFLKHYSDWVRLSLMDSNEKEQSGTVKRNRIIQEARHLYEAALHVRCQILVPHHPEVVATKFSLAELLDSPDASSLGVEKEDAIDSDRANMLREEILTAYNVEERVGDKVETIK